MRRLLESRTARLTALLAATVLSAACGGPRTPLELSVKEFPSDVLLGAPERETPVATTPAAVNIEPIGFPSFIQPPPPVPPRRQGPDAPPPPPTVPPAEPCPVANPLAAPVNVATRTISAPPADAGFTYRNEGRFRVARGSAINEGAYPQTSNRVVRSGPVARDGSFSFAVSEELGGPTTTTTFFVDPRVGLHLAAIQTTQLDGSSDSFVADDPRSLLLLPLPAAPGQRVGGVGVDPARRTALHLDGQVTDKVRVDACGTHLDAWGVEITDGRIVGPGKQILFTASYAIGTQYGGLSVRDTLKLRCPTPAPCDNGATVESENSSRTSREPALVAAR